MESGYINIYENSREEWVVEAKLIDGNLWLSKHQMAQLFGVFVNTIGNNLRSIFNNGLLHEHKVTIVNESDYEGKHYRTVFYNLEAIIFVSYRIGSFQARAFREWVMNALCEYNKVENKKTAEVLVVYNMSTRTQDIIPN